jgi:hypothetical protein
LKPEHIQRLGGKAQVARKASSHTGVGERLHLPHDEFCIALLSV